MNSSVWMDRALALARQRQGLTAPNPTVGAVLVKDGRVIGEGLHWGPGEPHAEAAALDDARSRGEDPRGSTLYVTLEPCCHAGPGKRTPPCAQRLVAEGIAEVYAAVADPNPQVCGRGMALLADAGIRVHWGPCEAQGRELIADFSAWVVAGRPFITLKWAQSLDGQVVGNDGAGPWISGVEARAHSHVLRACHDVVAVGAGTLRTDNPQLTVRDAPPGANRSPRRLIFAGSRLLPETARVFTDDDRDSTWVVARTGTPVWEQAQRLVQGRVLAWDGVSPDALGRTLLRAGFYRVFLEGGARLLNFFLREGLWDRLAVFTAPLGLGGIPMGPLAGLSLPLALSTPRWSILGRDVYLEGWNPQCPAEQGASAPGEAACSPV